MTKITACISSLAVFLVLCINNGNDSLDLADTKFLMEISTGNLTDTVLFNPSHECVFYYREGVYDFSSTSTTFESQKTNGTLTALSSLCAETTQSLCGEGLAFVYSDSQCLFTGTDF